MSAKESIGRISRDERLEILEHELDERVKELACLHGISRLAEQVDISRDELLQGIVNLIPSALQYPKIACARITLEEDDVRTNNFMKTDWGLAEDVILKEERIGSIEVYYLEERPENEEGPFQMEERALIFTVCEYMAKIISRIKNEEELRRSEKKYSALVENTTDGIIILQNGEVRFANTASLKLVGYHPEEMVGKNFLDFVAPRNRELVMKRYAARMAGKEVPPIYEMSILKNDGSELPVEVNAGLIEYEDGPADLVFIRDITERKTAENAIGESEEKLRRILDSSPDAIIVTDLEGRITECNRATLEAHGYGSKEELIGKNDLDLVVPKDKERARRDIDKMLKKGKSFRSEYTQLRKDLTTFEAEVSASAILDHKGKPSSFVIISKDVTERKKADQAMREIKDSLAEAQRIAHLGSWDWDIVNNELRWSDEIYRILGLKPNEFGATYGAFMNCIHPDDRKEVQNAVDEAVFKKKSYAIDHRIVRPDGEERIVHEEARVSFDSGGKKPVKMIGIVQDITDRRKAELAREESEERFKRILESSPDPITVTDLEGNIIECNQAMLKTFGFSSKDEAIGLNALEYISPGNREEAMEQMALILQGGPAQNIEYTALTKDGKPFLTEVSTSIIPDADGNPLSFVAISKDITERKKAEVTLNEKMQELERYKKVTVGRELKMIELKERIEDLECAIAEA
ncbi:MAG: PAS domain S-box protein [Thermoplasmata archaeon]